MGWLEDLAKTTVYKYRCIDDGDLITGTSEELAKYFECEVKGEPGEVLELMTNHNPEDAIKYEYAGFEPKKIGGCIRTTFEKNGRKAVRTKFADGSSTVRSMTRENLLKGKGVRETGDKHDASGNKTGKKSYEVDSVLTKACQEKSNEVKAKMVHNKVKDIRNQIAKNQSDRRKK